MKVLIADDETLIRRSLSWIAESRGHEVCLAEDGPSALAAWNKFQPDLVFLDILIPLLDGPSVLAQVKKKHERVVMISARRTWDQFSFNHPEELKGVDLFIPKPFKDIKAVFKKAAGLCDIKNEHR